MLSTTEKIYVYGYICHKYFAFFIYDVTLVGLDLVDVVDVDEHDLTILNRFFLKNWI